MKSDNEIQLFVYGTLKPGHSNFRQIEQFVVAHQLATARGILIDLKAFPAFAKGDGIVRGVLLTMQPQALTITDRIEGFVPNRKGNHYEREEIEVEISVGKKVKAWIYFYASPRPTVDRTALIVGYEKATPFYEWQG